MLKQELGAMGVTDVKMTKHGYVMATVDPRSVNKPAAR